MNLRPPLYLILSGSLAAGLYLAWNAKDSSTEIAQEPATAAIKSITRPSPPALEVAMPVKKGPTNAKTALEELKELAHSTTPEDTFKRYQILARCFHDAKELKSFDSWKINEDNQLHISERKPELEESKRYCIGVGYAAMAHRLDLLNIAVKAKVNGAANAFLYEGPFGDPNILESRPSDPAVIAWKKQAVEQLEAAAESGDRDTFLPLYQFYDDGINKVRDSFVDKDTFRAYIYHLAMYKSVGKTPSALAKNKLALEEKELSASQIEGAHKIVDELIKACCASNQSDGKTPTPLHFKLKGDEVSNGNLN